jgi:hypothetical protein
MKFSQEGFNFGKALKNSTLNLLFIGTIYSSVIAYISYKPKEKYWAEMEFNQELIPINEEEEWRPRKPIKRIKLE